MPTNKYFACPFCKERFTREDMIVHISRKHDEELPEGFTPLRAAFHAVNRKDFNYRRPCRICKKPTAWDENKGRYNFLCDNPNCKKAWIENMKNTMGDKYGAYRPTATAEGLEKMLAHRKISGTYKFSSGGEVPYTGSYEKKCLEFMDKVLDIKVEDIEVPGPVIKYPYRGSEHIYIPDIYYRPYNLIIEVKDGGSNPNTHPGYEEVRAKKIAKENYVIKHTEYNYLRQTDNDFSQLLGVFADLKLHLNNDDKSRVIHVHETTLGEHMGIAAINPMVGFIPGRDVVIANNTKRQTFGIANSPKFEKIVTINNLGQLGLDKADNFGSKEDVKLYVKKDIYPKIEKDIEKFMDREITQESFYELIFGHPMYTKDQILFEDVIDYSKLEYDMENFTIEATLNTIFGEDEESFCEGFEEFKSTFLNEEDVKYNYDAFSRGTSDVLFITGPASFGRAADFSGIAEQFGADIIHLDDVQKHYQYSDKTLKKKHKLIYQYFTETDKGIEYRKKKKKDIEVNLYETVPNFILYFLDNKEKDKRYIVEGTQIIDLLAANRLDIELLKKYSVLLKGSSYLQTQIQTMKSDMNNDSEKKAFDLLSDYIDAITKEVKKVTHGNFSKSLKKKDEDDRSVMDVIKDAFRESVEPIKESVLFNEKDIYHNKDKFDSNQINLCFITGHGGSGKSTMGKGMNADHYELDDVLTNYKFSDNELKEYGNLIYTYFKGPGKKYRYTSEEDMQAGNNPLDDSGDNYDRDLITSFVDYSIVYAKSHPNEKIVVEGIQLFLFIPPEKIKDYAVYIKGTSKIVSSFRAANRDTTNDGLKGFAKAKGMVQAMTDKKTNKYRSEDEVMINKYRQFFKEEVDMTEDYIECTDYNYNLDKWGTDSNILYITGLTGSGKTYTANKIFEEGGCELVSLDNISFYYMNSHNYPHMKNKIRTTLTEQCPEALEFLDTHDYALQQKYRDTIFIQKEFCNWFTKYNNSNKKYILEGDLLFYVHPVTWYTDKPVIVKFNEFADICKRRASRGIRGSHSSEIAEKEAQLQMNNKALKEHYDKIAADIRILSEATTKSDSSLPSVSKPWFITSDDGVDNACVSINGYDKPFRARSSMLIVKLGDDGKWQVFLSKDNEVNHEYHAPGGGWNKGESAEDAAKREAKEEVYMNVTNVKPEGFLIEYHDEVQPWVKDHVKDSKDWWYGYYSDIFVGQYDSKFTGKVEDIDKDQMANSAKWYKFEDIKENLTPKEYVDAIENYIREVDTPLDEDVFYCTEDNTIDLRGPVPSIPIDEITEEDLKKNMTLSPVFVVLSFNGGVIGKVIKGYGKDLGWEYSHSSISLTPSLSTLYSFNITKSTDEEGHKHKYNGLAIEHFRDFRDNPKCKIKVIAILVDRETKSKIKQAIQYYIDNIDKTKYATKSLGKALLGTGANVQNYGNMTLFCSQFVDSVLKQANIDIGGKGSSINVHPSELGQFKDKNNYFTIYEGKASGYNEDEVNDKIIYMKQTMTHKELNAITDKSNTVNKDDHTVENRAKEFVQRKVDKFKANHSKNKETPEPLDGPLAVEGGAR